MPRIDYPVSEIEKIVKGDLISNQSHDIPIKDILIDSRRLISPDNCIFFALVSKRNDGHKYIEELYKKGIRYFIVSHLPQNFKEYKNTAFILVKNTLNALQLLSAAHRKKFDIPVIGITGSNGKTIVKEWLYQLMSEN
ncbi:MAG: bifunctional UDP-N-acetylmuramoyl-tripeptide:D-alanyl-D-alanine ligase/alanine racemase, partial [Bacteroidales bacterium]|nr:bifunctional UDP-N-acetylmuramoyl-tripeptide:D-alanyl-D-alanine ligase/alanine racemase [Bacteroidales bacterium]